MKNVGKPQPPAPYPHLRALHPLRLNQRRVIRGALKRASPSEWKTGTQEPWIPPEVPSQFEHLDDLPDIVRLMYNLLRFASMGHSAAPAPDGVRAGPLPTVTVGPVQNANPPQQQQQQSQQQQPVEPMPDICKTQQCA